MIEPLKKTKFSINKDAISLYENLLFKKDNLDRKKTNNEFFYIYKMKSKMVCQTGLVCLVSIDKPDVDKIFPHELTLLEREDHYFDWMCDKGEQISPVLMIHEHNLEIFTLLNKLMLTTRSFISIFKQGVRHSVWEINDPYLIQLIKKAYGSVRNLYIADGHHRLAAIKRLSEIKPWVNHISALLVPHDQVKILSFYRVVELLNKKNKDELLKKLRSFFEIRHSPHAFQPCCQGEIGLYVDNVWYCLRLREEILENLSDTQRIGTSILEEYILKLLKKYQINYLNGDKDLKYLKNEVDNKRNALGFSVAPIDINEFLKISRQGIMLPAKSTYFLPKPLSDVMHYKMDLFDSETMSIV